MQWCPFPGNPGWMESLLIQIIWTTCVVTASNSQDEIPPFPKLTLVAKLSLSCSFPGVHNVASSCECLFWEIRAQKGNRIFWHCSNLMKTSCLVTVNHKEPQGRTFALLEQSTISQYLKGEFHLKLPYQPYSKGKKSHYWWLAQYLCLFLINILLSFIYFGLIKQKIEPSAPTLEPDREVAMDIFDWMQLYSGTGQSTHT